MMGGEGYSFCDVEYLFYRLAGGGCIGGGGYCLSKGRTCRDETFQGFSGFLKILVKMKSSGHDAGTSF